MSSPADAHVTILMSTFDGESYLDDLVESIRSQTHATWSLLCRDDGSSDGTAERLRALARADDRISVVVDEGTRLGSAASFMRLLGMVEGGYFAFCDQDDVWEPHKLEWSVAALRQMTAPIAAVCTDAFVCDENARIEAPSALTARGLRHPPTFGELLMINAAIGATMLGTAELAAAAVAVGEDDPIMHDWWCALVAAYAGDFRVLPFPTIRWRRHEQTATGGSGGQGSIGRARRREYVAWSARAARLLDDSTLVPISPLVSRAAATLGDLDRRGPTLPRLLAADRAGARAWPLRRRVAAFAAIASSS